MIWQKKKLGKSPGYHPYTNEDMNKWQIDIIINKKLHTDPNRYNNETVYNKVNEYYKYYYDKHNKQ